MVLSDTGNTMSNTTQQSGMTDYATLRGVRYAYQSLPPYGPDFDVTPRGEAVMLAHNLPPSYTPFKGKLV